MTSAPVNAPKQDAAPVYANAFRKRFSAVKFSEIKLQLICCSGNKPMCLLEVICNENCKSPILISQFSGASALSFFQTPVKLPLELGTNSQCAIDFQEFFGKPGLK